MSSVFISYGNGDRARAEELKQHLEDAGFRSVFLDVHDIAPGADWEHELYRRLRGCRTLVALCTGALLESKWCFAEIALARTLGKPVFPVMLEDGAVHPLLRSAQAIDLRAADPAAYHRLFSSLRRVGVVEGTWDPERSPYPGLACFAEEDAAVFFGREGPIEDVLSILTTLGESRGPSWLTLLGASGSGKSSLLRAGVLPRLRGDASRWIVTSPVRCGKDPFESTALVLEETFRSVDGPCEVSALADALRASTTESLTALAGDLRRAARSPEASVLLAIDQFEELLLRAAHDGAETSVGNFLSMLRRMTCLPGAPFFVLTTLRSDFLGAFQGNASLRGIDCHELVVKPIPVSELRRVVEAPAALANIELEPGLLEELLRDADAPDALPLLAYCLRWLHDRAGASGRLGLKDYREGLGGLQHAIALQADALLAHEGLNAQAKSVDAFKSTFLALVAINEHGKPVRRRVRWADIPVAAHGLLERFVRARLLVSSSEPGNDRELEVAHEALFRHWTTLSSWIGENKELLTWRARTDPALSSWERSRETDALLRGSPLAEAQGWCERCRALLTPNEIAFIESSAAYGRRRRRGLLAGFFMVLIALTALAAVGWWQNGVARTMYVEAWNGMRLAAARKEGDPALRALLLRELPGPSSVHRQWQYDLWDAAEVVKPSAFLVHGFDAVPSTDGSSVLVDSSKAFRVQATSGLEAPVTLLSGGRLLARAFGDDGSRILAVRSDGQMLAWGRTPSGGWEPRQLPHESAGRELSFAAFSTDGRTLVSVAAGGAVRTTPTSGEGAAVHFAAASGVEAHTLATSADGATVAASCGDEVCVWKHDEPTIVRTLPVKTNRISLSGDGRTLVTSADDVRVWDLAGGSDARVLPDSRYAINAKLERPGRRVYAMRDRRLLKWTLDGRFEPLPLELMGDYSSQDAVNEILLSEDGKYLATLHEGRAKIWNTDGIFDDPVVIDGTSDIKFEAFSFDGRILVGTTSGATRVWKIRERERQSFNLGTMHKIPVVGEVHAVAVSPDGRRIAAGGKTFIIWERDGTRPPLVFSSPEARVMCMTFNADGSLKTYTEDGESNTWTDRDAIKEKPPFIDFAGPLHVPVACAPNSVVVGSRAGLYVLTGGHRRALKAAASSSGGVKTVAMSPDGSTVAAGFGDETIWVWPAGSSNSPRLVARLASPPTALSFSPRQTELVIGSPGQVRVVSLANGSEVVRPVGCRVSAVAGSPDGGMIAAGCEDGNTHVWDSDGVTDVIRDTTKVTYVRFLPERGKLLTLSSRVFIRTLDPRTKLWRDMPYCQTKEERVLLLGEAPDTAEAAVARCRDTVARCGTSLDVCAEAVRKAYETPRPWIVDLLAN